MSTPTASGSRATLPGLPTTAAPTLPERLVLAFPVPGREGEAHAADESILLEARQPDALGAQAVPALASKRGATPPAGEIIAVIRADGLPSSETTMWSVKDEDPAPRKTLHG
jgi:hypothetical protein